MISVLVYKKGNYPLSSPRIKKVMREFFLRNGIVSDAEVSISVVGQKTMDKLVKKYLNDGQRHSVLSFTNDQLKDFVYPPGKIDLGEIVICYPLVVEEAKKEGKLIETKALELLEHGGEHLLGKHHE